MVETSLSDDHGVDGPVMMIVPGLQINYNQSFEVMGPFQHKFVEPSFEAKTYLGQNSVWRRTGCNGGRAEMTEPNCETKNI